MCMYMEFSLGYMQGVIMDKTAVFFLLIILYMHDSDGYTIAT